MLPNIYKNNAGKSAGKSHEKSFRTGIFAAKIRNKLFNNIKH